MATKTAVFAVRSAKPCFAGLLVYLFIIKSLLSLIMEMIGLCAKQLKKQIMISNFASRNIEVFKKYFGQLDIRVNNYSTSKAECEICCKMCLIYLQELTVCF